MNVPLVPTPTVLAKDSGDRFSCHTAHPRHGNRKRQHAPQTATSATSKKIGCDFSVSDAAHTTSPAEANERHAATMTNAKIARMFLERSVWKVAGWCNQSQAQRRRCETLGPPYFMCPATVRQLKLHCCHFSTLHLCCVSFVFRILRLKLAWHCMHRRVNICMPR